MHARDWCALEDRLSREHDRNILLVGNDYFTNAWAAYCARHNRLWLTYPYVNDVVDVNTCPGGRSLTDLETLPRDCLFLTSTESLLPTPSEGFGKAEWTAGAYTLWTPKGDDWAVIVALTNPIKMATPLGTFFWMGGSESTDLTVLTARAGILELKGKFSPGPSLPETSERTVEIQAEDHFVGRFVVGPSTKGLPVPVSAGVTRIKLRVLEAATVAQLPNGDKRPLLLGIRSLSASLLRDPELRRSDGGHEETAEDRVH
jgi:hypothetical protein